ncbi:MAG: cadherin-like beta sandwich domain-containing protein, partial [Deltaproteobacteria bacterium]|nr:cadherin-like beta sandwich domain-containing protein [Deltaproteobacteria bacterium]
MVRAGGAAGVARGWRRLVWGLVLGAVLGVGVMPSVSWAQTFTRRGAAAVDEGTLGMDGMLTASTVTLHRGVSWGVGGTIQYAWDQIDRATATTITSSLVQISCSGGALSSSDPNYVTLSGATGMFDVTTSLEQRLGTPSFTAPEVAETIRLYFRVSVTRMRDNTETVCATYHVDIRDVQPPVVDLGTDQSVDEGDAVTIAATTSGDPDGAGAVPLSFLLLTSTTGPTPSFNWIAQPLYECVAADPVTRECIGEPRLVQAAHSTTFTAPVADADYTLNFTVTVYDSGGRSGTDTLTINVAAAGGTPGPTAPTPTPNRPPVANAGPDQTVDEDSAPSVTLDGTGSSDPDGDRLRYRWTQTSGPDVAFLSGGSIPSPSFRLTQFTADATLVFSLVVTDDSTAQGVSSAPDTVTIRITADDDLPVVSAGANQRVDQGLRVTLLGQATDEAPPTVQWTQTAGPTVALSGATTLRPRFIAPLVRTDATLTFQLRATEAGGAGRNVDDAVNVLVVVDSPPPTPAQEVYVVEAGDDLTVAGGEEVTLYGTGYIRGTPTVTANNWGFIQESGPQVALSGAYIRSGGVTDGTDDIDDEFAPDYPAPGTSYSAACDCYLSADSSSTESQFRTTYRRRMTFTAPTPATTQTLVFRFRGQRLRAPSGTLSTLEASDIVTVTVTGSDPTATQATVNAGPDQTVAEGATVTLAGSSTFSSPSYRWYQVSGPAVSLSDSSVAGPTFTAPSNLPGTSTLVFQLVVLIGTPDAITQASVPDSVSVTVTTTNRAPSAFAGSDAAVAEGAMVTLGHATNTGTDPDSGDTLSYQWTQFGGPAVTLSDATVARPTFTAPSDLAVVARLYFQVVVSDADGATGRDEVVIQVNGENAMPTVSASANPASAAEDDSITMTSTFSDEESTVYVEWTQDTTAADSGPVVSLLDARLPRHTFTAPNFTRDYQLYFTVTARDEHGGSATANVTIAVTADSDAPIAAAGNYTATAGSTVRMNGGQRDFLGSRDPEGGALSFAWEQVLASEALDAQGQPAYDDDGRRTLVYTAIAMDHADRVALAGADTATPSFTAPGRAASLLFRLTVTDVDGLTGVDVATVQVAGGAAVGADVAADAGDDLSAFEGSVVTLRGEGNYPDSELTFTWEQISGTPEVSLSSSAPNSARTPTFVAPDLSAASATLGFRLTVQHSGGQSATDEMQVTVNRVFTAAAGRVVYVDSGLTGCMDSMGDSVDCPQVPSVSADGITLVEGTEGFLNVEVVVDDHAPDVPRRYRYEWEQTSGQAVLLPQGQGGFSFIAPTPIAADMVLEFRVTVTSLVNAYGNALAPEAVISAVSDPVQVTVTRDASATRPTIGMNIAGEDLTAEAGSVVTLQGTVGADPPGTRIIRRWTQISGARVALQQVDESNGVARFRSQRPGVFGFQFEVIQLSGTESTVPGSTSGTLNMLSAIGSADSMQVTLTNRPPVANAGMDLDVNANAAVTLDGSDSRDPDEGDVIAYAWTQAPPLPAADGQINFIMPVALANANTAMPTFTAPSLPVGDHLDFTLQVTDSEGEVSEDVVRVFVQPDPAYADPDNPNRAPVAHAGADLQVLPGAQFTLDGRLSGDPDYAGLDRFDAARPALGYQWTQLSGPSIASPHGALGAPASVASSVSATLTAPANAGSAPVEMVFRLVVTDGVAFSAPDDVTVTVAGNADATLASLAVNLFTISGPITTPGALQLSPAFDPGTTAYEVSVPSSFNAIGVAAVPRARGATAARPDPMMAASLAGATVAVTATDASGAALTPEAYQMSTEQFSVSSFTEGANTVTVTVTAPDGTATETYTLTVTRAARADGSASTLAGLFLRTPLVTLGTGAAARNHGDLIALSPAFDTDVTGYTAQVPNQVRSMRIAWLRSTNTWSEDRSTAMIGPEGGTAASCTIEATVGFGGGTARSDGRLADCDLAVGANTLTLRISEPSGSFSAATTYTVTVTRAMPSTDATLSALSVSGLRSEVSPAFASATTSYTAQVGGFAMDVIPVTSHQGASFAVSGTAPGGAALAVIGARVSGAAARITGLLEGENTITIRVYAEDSSCFAREADGTAAPSVCATGSDTATTLRVPDTQSPTTTRDYTLRVMRIGTPPQIASVSAAEMNLFLAVPVAPLRFTNSGGALPPGAWSVTPALPAGLSLDAETGEISGSPTAAQAAAEYTVTAANAWGESSVVLSIAVAASMRTVTVARVAETVAEDGTPGAAEFSLTMSGVSPTADIDVAWTLSGADGASLPGAANADFGAPAGAGIAVAANGISGTARWATGATLPQTLTLRVPVLQDVLNEGAETLTLTLGALTTGGQAAPVSEVELGSDVSAVVTVLASDDISISLARRAGDSGRLVSGDAANYVAALGATASTQLTLSIDAMLGSTDLSRQVTAAVGATEAAFAIPACDASATPPVSTGCIDAVMAAASGEMQLMVSVSGVTGAPTGATAAPHATNAAAANIGVVGWEIGLSGADRVGEGGALMVTVTLRGAATPTSLTVPWQVQSSMAEAADFSRNADYMCGAAAEGDMCTALPSGTLDFSGASDAAARTRTIALQTARDDEDESAAPESFTVSFGTPGGTQGPALGILGTASTLTAAISDALRTLSVTGPTAAVDEDSVTAAGQTAFAEFIITLDGTEPPVSDVVVNWTLSSPADGGVELPAAAGLGRNVEARDVGGARTGTVIFVAGASFSFPATQMVRVPILQDALNEGVE